MAITVLNNMYFFFELPRAASSIVQRPHRGGDAVQGTGAGAAEDDALAERSQRGGGGWQGWGGFDLDRSADSLW